MGIISGVGPIITAHEVGHLYGGEHPEANMRGVWDATVMWNPAHGKTCNSDPAYVYGHYPEVGDCNIDDFDDVIQSL